MGKRIGIDLGTTNCVIAILEPGGVRVLDNKEGKNMTPSVVSFNSKKNEIIVGETARNRLGIAPKETIFSVKRIMGRGIKDKEIVKMVDKVPYTIQKPKNGTEDSVCVIINGQEYSPEEISALILKKLKQDAEFRLGDEVTDAVITVPAYFSEIQKFATREAGRKAGLNVLRILDEPTAAAISYGINVEEAANEPKLALVFDLGGGTFDISVLAITAGTIIPMNLEGDMWLGGDDFDQVIIDKVVQGLQKEENINPLGSSKVMATIKHEAQKAKETLAASNTADILIEGMTEAGEKILYETEVSRVNFDAWIKDLLARAEKLVDKAMQAAGLDESSIDYVIMAGNSTLIPAVQDLMETKFGAEKVKRKHHPKLCVAEGAAIAAAQLTEGVIICPKCGHECDKSATECNDCGFKLFQQEESANSEKIDGIAPFHYGLQVTGDKFSVFIEKNDPYKTKPENIKTKTFYTTFANQRIVDIPIYGGENLEKASANDKGGEVFAILPSKLPQGTPYKIRLWLNEHCIFQLESALDNGTSLDCIILRGKDDKTAVLKFLEACTEFDNFKNFMAPEEYKALESKIEQGLSTIKKFNFHDAINFFDALIQEIRRGGGANDPWKDIELWLMYGRKTINDYSFLIESTTEIYKINNLIGDLEDQIRNKTNIKVAQEKKDLLLKTIDDLKWFDRATFQPTNFGMVLICEEDLLFAKQINPARVNELEASFRNCINMIKAGQVQEAGTQLFSIFMEAEDMIKNDTRNLLTCPHCGEGNNAGTINCKKCGLPIHVPGGDKIKTSFSSMR